MESNRIKQQFGLNRWHNVRPSFVLVKLGMIDTEAKARYRIKKGKVRINGGLIKSDELINPPGNYIINYGGINNGFSVN